jgi:raffinose/stachyose/melibiose transport system permease protein
MSTTMPIASDSTTALAAPRRKAVRRGGQGKWPVLILFLPPALLLFTVFVILPMGEAAWYSLYNWNGYSLPTEWVGLKNFELIFKNGAFRTALVNNGLIILISICIQVPLALWLATLVTKSVRGAVAFRLIFFLPYVLADVAAGMIWRFVYDGEFGLVSSIWGAFGQEAPFWLADKSTAMAAVLGVIVWKYFGFHMMLFIAALQSLDKSLVEAARIDGATRSQALRHVVIPLLYPTIRLSVFFAIVGSLQLFDLVMPLTRGGPADSSNTMVSFLYNNGISRMRVGYGSAIGVILFAICVTFAFTYKRWFMRDE